MAAPEHRPDDRGHLRLRPLPGRRVGWTGTRSRLDQRDGRSGSLRRLGEHLMATAGKTVVRSGGKRGVLASGKAAVFDSEGQCSTCCNIYKLTPCYDPDNL